MITCTFAGHREPASKQDALAIPSRLASAVGQLLKSDDEFRFYFGGMGWFDETSLREVWYARREWQDKRIELVLVQPYERRVASRQLYDEVLLPDELRALDPRAAIPARNRWLIEHSDCLIAYVRRDAGGAAATLRHARSRGIRILQL